MNPLMLANNKPVSAEEFEETFIYLKHIIIGESWNLPNTYNSLELLFLTEYLYNIKQIIISQEKILRKNITHLRRAAIKSFFDVKGILAIKDIREKYENISRMSIVERLQECRCRKGGYETLYINGNGEDISPLQNPVDTSFDVDTFSRYVNYQISPVSRYFGGCEYCRPEKAIEEEGWCSLKTIVSPFAPSDSDSEVDVSTLTKEKDTKSSDISEEALASVGTTVGSYNSRTSSIKKRISFGESNQTWEFDTQEPDRRFYFRDLATRVFENNSTKHFQQLLFGFDTTDFFSWDLAEERSYFF